MHLTLVTEWKRSSIPSILNWCSDISSDSFLSSVLLVVGGVSVMVIVTVGVTVVVVAVVIVIVVVCSSIIKLPFVIVVPLSRVTLNLPV